jgi:opacity protein-like surface antigen
MLWVAVVLTVLGMTAAGGQGDVGARAGYLRIPDADDGTFVLGGYFRYDWREIAFLETAVYYHDDEVREGVDMEFIPIQFSAMLYLLGRKGSWSPFILGGGGVYWTRTTEAGGDSDSDFDFGWHLGAGADVNLSERFFIEGDLRYIWLDIDTKGRTLADALSDFNHWMASVGIGFRL